MFTHASTHTCLLQTYSSHTLPYTHVQSLRRDATLPLAVLHGFLAAPASAARLRVELHSRELLVVWTALCMVHAAGCAAHPALREFGVGVRWQDLRHCVLSDRLACDALLAVAAYLRANSAPGREAFSLRDGGRATFALAAQHAGQDGRILEIWGQEAEAAEARRAAHWSAVQRKQAAAAGMRERLAAQREAEIEAEAALRRAEAAWCESRYQKNQQVWASCLWCCCMPLAFGTGMGACHKIGTMIQWITWAHMLCAPIRLGWMVAARCETRLISCLWPFAPCVVVRLLFSGPVHAPSARFPDSKA